MTAVRTSDRSVATDIKVIDTDSHLTEPPDLWTSRLPKKWLDDAPRVELHEPSGELRWRIGDKWVAKVGNFSIAGTGAAPKSFEDINPACYDLDARLAWMDRYGIYAQVLYPNIVALEGHAILALKDAELRFACIRANNDYAAEFAGRSGGRFIPVASLPFWDIDASIAEMERARDLGHRGVVWAARMDKHNLPGPTSEYWDRFYAAAQDLEMSINFHVGVGYTEEEMNIANHRDGQIKDDALTTMRTAVGFMSNGRTIASVIMSGLVERFPRLNFVSVESGFGFLPYLLEALDWQWTNSGSAKRNPHRMLPSEYFRRQVYAMFWFEQTTLPLLHLYPDNIMFETDFPHDTSLTPGPGSVAPAPSALIDSHIETYGEDLMRKVLYANAARLYHLESA